MCGVIRRISQPIPVPFRKAKGDAERSERRGMPGVVGRQGFPRSAGEMSEGQRGRESTNQTTTP